MSVFLTIRRVFFTFFAIVVRLACIKLPCVVLYRFLLDGVLRDVHVKHSPQLHLNECNRGFHSGALFLVEADGHSLNSLADLRIHRGELGVN